MSRPTGSDRWREAQDYERSYWLHRAEQISSGETGTLKWYQWRADRLVEWLGAVGPQVSSSPPGRVLEIGCGPVGIVSFLASERRVGIDPLERFYHERSTLVQPRNEGATYVCGAGERLPFPASSFDLLVIDNCIDHVRDPDAVLREAGRVLKGGGTLYVSVNCRTAFGFVVHRLLSKLIVDAGHPHTYTESRARRQVGRYFEVVDTRSEDAFDPFREDLLSRVPRRVLKALLGVSEHLFELLAVRGEPERAGRTPQQAW